MVMDVTSKASFPLHNAEARRHQENLDVTSDVVLRCFGADFGEGDATKNFSVKKGFSVKRGEAIQ